MTSPIFNLSPFIGPKRLLRAKRRTQLLENATFGRKYSETLDARHPLFRLFLEHLQERHYHHGVEFLRALTQQNFPILKLRTTSRSIQLKCVTCRKRKTQTFTPIIVVIPQKRLVFWSPQFTNTGIDYFGPFYVSVKRLTEIRWGFFFSSLTLRAVYIEVASSMDTSSWGKGIERFVARHIVPGVIWSHNGTNFIATEKEFLNNTLNWSQ